MNAPVDSTTRAAPPSRAGQRIAVAVVMGVLVFFGLWLWVFSVVTSALIASGCCAVIVVAGSVSEVVEAVLDAIGNVIFGIFAAIAAIFAAIFSLFGF